MLRFGHTTTGVENHPAPAAGLGLECDKLSKEAAEAHFNGLMGKLIADSEPLAGQGRTLVSTHIDSWEVGSQNWTPRMREEFRKRRGYDLLPLLPVLTGRVVDSLRGLRAVPLGPAADGLGHARGELRRPLPPSWPTGTACGSRSKPTTTCPCDEMTYAGQADEPMAEFWSWEKFSAAYSCTEMSSAAHTYGKRILGAEAFTANDHEKWQGHPATIKDLGDWAFCEGINRFVFHRYALQPWQRPAARHVHGPLGPALRADARPGGSSRSLGTSTSPAASTCCSRACSWPTSVTSSPRAHRGVFAAGRRGRFAAGHVAPQGVRRDVYRPGYNFDGCTPEVVLTRMTVRDGRIVLPDGMSYRVLVLPAVETMTPALLGQDQGAGRGRGHGGRPVAAAEVAEPGRLSRSATPRCRS